MGIFVVQFRNLSNQISQLEKQVAYYDEQIRKERFELVSHNLQEEMEALKSFQTDFEELIVETYRKPTTQEQDEAIVDSVFDEESTREDFSDLFDKDIFGNSLESQFSLYNYAEISYGTSGKFSTVRLLGVKGVEKIRYYITDLSHPFSPTTIKLLENIRDITESKSLYNFKQLMTCKKRDAWKSDLEILNDQDQSDYTYDWAGFISYFLVPSGIIEPIGEMTDEEREEIIRKMNSTSTLTKEQAIENNRKLQAKKRELEEKARKDKEKSVDILKQMEDSLRKSGQKTAQQTITLVSQFLDKFSIGCIVKETLECLKPANSTCRDLFKDLSVTEIFDRLALVYPRGSKTFRELENAIEKAVLGDLTDLKDQIKQKELRIVEDERLLQVLMSKDETPELKQNKETLISNIEIHKQELETLRENYKNEEDRVMGDLNLSERQKSVVRQSGNVSALFTLPVEEDERIGIVTITDKVINAIDAIVPLEDVCEAITNAFSIAGGQFPFVQFEGFPPLAFPEPRPVNDIFSGISLELGSFFVQGLVVGVLTFLRGLLDQLLNCDNLDALVANIVGGEQDQNNSGIYGDLALLFGGNAEFPNANQVLEQQYDSFIERSVPYFQDILKVKVGSDSPTGSTASTSIGTDPATTADLLNGEGDLATAAAEAVQQSLVDNVSSNRQGVLDFFLRQDTNPLANWDISFDGEKFEVSDGLRVIDIEEFDKFFNSVSESFLSTLGQENFSVGALQDAFVLVTQRDREDVSFAESQTEQALEEVTKDQLSKEFGDLFKACNSLLTPTELIGLLSGNASPNAIKLTKELMCLKSPRLCKVLGTPAEIKNMFNNFGKFSGLSELKDELDIIASLPISRERNVSPNLCKPFDNVEEFRKSLMQRSVTPEIANAILDNINAEKINNFNNIGRNIINFGKGSADQKPTPAREKAIKSILDAAKGLGVESPSKEEADPSEPKSLQEKTKEAAEQALENSAPFKDILASATHSLFNPIKKAFNSDIDSYIEFLSSTREVEREVKRYEVVQSGSNSYKAVATNDFRTLLNNGLVPIKQGDRAIMVDGKPDGDAIDGDLDGKADQKYLPELNDRGEAIDQLLPVYKKENAKIIGYQFRTAFENIQNSITVNTSGDNLNITLGGSLNENNAIMEFSNNLSGLFGDLFGTIMGAVQESMPRWRIELKEDNIRNYFSINPTGSFFVPANGLVSFGDKYEYSSSKPLLDDEIATIAVEKYGDVNSLPSKKNTFLDLIDYQKELTREIKRRFNNTQIASFNSYLEKVYPSFIEDFVASFADSIKNTSLLKEIESGEDETKSLIAIQLINFIREASEQEKQDNIDPHIFDFASLEKKFSELYDKNKQRILSDTQQLRGMKKRDSRFGKSANVVLAKAFIRLNVADYLFKTIFVSDYFNFSKYFAKLELITEHISNITQSDLKQRGVYQTFSQFIIQAYQEELSNEKVEEITVAEKTDFLQGRNTILPEIKKLVKIELNNLYCKLAALLGKEQRADSGVLSFVEPFLKDIPLIYVHPRALEGNAPFRGIGYQELMKEKYDELQARLLEELGQTTSALTQNQLNIGRNQADLENRQNSILGRIVLEKYIKFGKVNKEYYQKFNDYGYDGLKSLENKEISLEDYRTIVFYILSFSLPATSEPFLVYNCDDSSQGLFSKPLTYGVRLVFVSETEDSNLNGTDFFVQEDSNRQFIGQKNKFNIFKISQKEWVDRPSSNASAQEHLQEVIGTGSEQFEEKLEGIFNTLRTQVFEEKESKLLFGYTIPIKQLASMFMIHSYYVHSDERMKYLFETTKQVIIDFSQRLDNIGLKNNAISGITAMAEKQKLREENTGNPGGPIDLSALKFFYRTPIQILKGLAALVDPNIFIADKIVMATSLIGALTGQKIFLPYSAASLALLPFPLFTGPPPAGIAPPLTAYNIALPLGPIFLALEPLLWDLPWFKFNNSETDTAKEGLRLLNTGKELPEELSPDLLKCADENEEENNS